MTSCLLGRLVLDKTRHEAEKFSLEAAMVPLQILQRSFLILPPAKPEEYLLNPITLLGLRDHPFYFNAMALQQYLSQTEECVHLSLIHI